MASRDHPSNPFWWVVLGFICGAIATLGALILYGGGTEARDERPSGPAAAIPLDPEPAREAPARAEPGPQPVVAPDSAVPAPVTEPSPEPPPAVDPQIADDAAAAGMTARSSRN